MYRPLNQKRLVDLHPDFIKYAVSEQFLYLSLKLGFLSRTPLAGSRDAAAKAKARSQATARASIRAGQFPTPERARTEFKADMLDQFGELEAERAQRYMEPFQLFARETPAAHAVFLSTASSSSAAPPPPPAPLLAFLPVRAEGDEGTVLLCFSQNKLHTNTPRGSVRAFAHNFCSLFVR